MFIKTVPLPQDPASNAVFTAPVWFYVVLDEDSRAKKINKMT
jgi:hypothetical protein